MTLTTKDREILFDQTKGLFVVDDDFTTVTEIPTDEERSYPGLFKGHRICYCSVTLD